MYQNNLQIAIYVSITIITYEIRIAASKVVLYFSLIEIWL